MCVPKVQIWTPQHASEDRRVAQWWWILSIIAHAPWISLMDSLVWLVPTIFLLLNEQLIVPPHEFSTVQLYLTSWKACVSFQFGHLLKINTNSIPNFLKRCPVYLQNNGSLVCCCCRLEIGALIGQIIHTKEMIQSIENNTISELSASGDTIPILGVDKISLQHTQYLDRAVACP